MLRSVLSANSRAEKMPAGPAPTIMTPKFIKGFLRNPNLQRIGAIYVLAGKNKQDNQQLLEADNKRLNTKTGFNKLFNSKKGETLSLTLF
jgi:hypothetical protein